MKNLKYIMASACIALLSISSVSANNAYTAQESVSSNKVTISGAGAENEKIVLQILKKDKLFTDYSAGDDANDFILWQDQLTIGEDKAFSFSAVYDSKLPAGAYSARIISDMNGVLDEQILELVGSDTYSEAVVNMLSAAQEKRYADFVACIDGGDKKASPVGFDLSLYRKINYTADKAKAYAQFVAESEAADFAEAKCFDAESQKSRSAYFNSFVLIEALNTVEIDNIKDALSESSIGLYETALWSDVCNCITQDSEWSYFEGKLQKSVKKAASPQDLKKAVIEALVLTETKFADGNNIKDVIVTLGYGEDIGISNPSTKTKVYTALNGKDYADIDAFIDAYNASKKKNESSSSSGGGSSSSSSSSSGGVSVPSLSYDPKRDESAAAKPGVVDVNFVDLEGVSWAAEAIVALADKGIIAGRGDGYFEPNENVTREEFAKIIVCALGLENASFAKNYFSDAEDGDWFAKYINIAYENGIVNGIGDGKFGVGKLITRQDMTVILSNALKMKGAELTKGELSFEDTNMISAYALSSVEALYGMGIISGVSETSFDAHGYATRAQAAQIVYRALKYMQ